MPPNNIRCARKHAVDERHQTVCRRDQFVVTGALSIYRGRARVEAMISPSSSKINTPGLYERMGGQTPPFAMGWHRARPHQFV
jgi:hypothetical protein